MRDTRVLNARQAIYFGETHRFRSTYLGYFMLIFNCGFNLLEELTFAALVFLDSLKTLFVL